MKNVLIVGITSQDGFYLANLLCRKGYAVFGTSRFPVNIAEAELRKKKFSHEIIVYQLDPTNSLKVQELLLSKDFAKIFVFAGQSSVSESFKNPSLTLNDNQLIVNNILETSKFNGLKSQIYIASSGEIFGNTVQTAAVESTHKNPMSPYAVSKLVNLEMSKIYRNAYGVPVYCGILFNHESSMRPQHFVTMKIISFVARFSAGRNPKLNLGNINISRDWGWAPEYVEGMNLMLDLSEPDDFILATGVSTSLKDFIKIAFRMKGLDWQEHTVINPTLGRPADPIKSYGNPQKASEKLNWTALVTIHELIERIMYSVQNEK